MSFGVAWGVQSGTRQSAGRMRGLDGEVLLACAEQIAWGKFGLGAGQLLGIAWESAGLELRRIAGRVACASDGQLFPARMDRC